MVSTNIILARSDAYQKPFYLLLDLAHPTRAAAQLQASVRSLMSHHECGLGSRP